MDTIIPQDDTPYKQCNACFNSYPATLAYFHKGSRYNKMGLSTKCKRCKGKGTNFGKIRGPKEHRLDEKECSRCNKWLPKNTDYFNVDNGRKDRLNPACKECLYEDRVKRKDKIDRQQEAYKINNRERLVERERARDKRDRKKRREQARQSYQRHKGKRKAYVHQYRIEHPEECKAYGRQHYHLHKEQYYAHVTARKARKRAVKGSYTPEQIQDQLKRQKYRCYYGACGHAKFKKVNGRYQYHIEHTYPLSRVVGSDIPANDIGYLVLACPACNLSKGDKFPWEWASGGRLL